jgi:hypothetical protein
MKNEMCGHLVIGTRTGSSRLELESLSRQVVGLESVTEHARVPRVHVICDRDFDSGSCAGSIPMQFDAIVGTNSLVFSIT